MANIAISVKGKFEINLTRNYNSLAVFNENKDDIGFNDSVNDFYNYCLSSPCGSWVGDKIKVLTLPDKGRLFYNATPLSTPTYSNVTVGQEISVRDLIDYKVLKFSAEGSYNNQFSENYFTAFTFERYCTANAQNITVSVKLNMIDDKNAQPNIFITDVVLDEPNGNVDYILHVVNTTFVGYANGLFRNGTQNSRSKKAIYSSFSVPTLIIDANKPPLFDIENFTAVTLVAGTYSESINISCVGVPNTENVSAAAELHFCLTPDFDNIITTATCYLTVEGIPA